MIGSFLVTLLLSSTDDETLDERRGSLLDFQGTLESLAESTRTTSDAAKLPFRRLTLIIDQLFRDPEVQAPADE